MAKGITKAHIQFINLIAKGESQKDAYRVSIGKKTVTDGFASKEGSLLAKRYASEIQAERERIANVITQANQSKEALEALKSILTEAQVDKILCDAILQPESEAGKLKAIDIYYKRFGSNGLIKQEMTITQQVLSNDPLVNDSGNPST